MNIPCLQCGKSREIKLNESKENYLKRRPICLECGHIKRIKTLDGHAPNWKGGRTLDSKGYVLIWIEGRGYVKEHRYVWEKHFGKIPKGYIIHHKNENKEDNRIENLECITKKVHDKMNPLIKHLADVRWGNITKEDAKCLAKV